MGVIATLLQLLGLAVVAFAAYMLSPWLLAFVIGVAILVTGVALERN